MEIFLAAAVLFFLTPSSAFALGGEAMVGGLLKLSAIWLIAIVASFFIKPRAISILTAIFGPIVAVLIYVATGSISQKLRHQELLMNMESARREINEICKLEPTINIYEQVLIDKPVSVIVTIEGNKPNEDLTFVKNCWNAEDISSCNYIPPARALPCWMTEQGCYNPNIASLEYISYSGKVSKITLPATNRYDSEELDTFTTPYELKFSKKQTLKERLALYDLEVVDIKRKKTLSNVTIAVFNGQEYNRRSEDYRGNYPSKFCPNREQMVSILLKNTFKMKN